MGSLGFLQLDFEPFLDLCRRLATLPQIFQLIRKFISPAYAGIHAHKDIPPFRHVSQAAQTIRNGDGQEHSSIHS
jgi:hypothetical protein